MARRIVGIVVERRLVTVPVAGPVGCAEFDDCCPGSGSGSGCGEGCVVTCDACETGMSGTWVLRRYGTDDVVLCHDPDGADGTNYCTFDSADLVWQLQYDHADDVWLLKNHTTGRVWFVAGTEWDCLGDNTLEPVEPGDPEALLHPVDDCSEITYDCVDGTCVPVPGTGGTYPTLAACRAACGGGAPVAACGCATVPRTLYAHFSGALAALGTVPLTYALGAWSSGTTPDCGGMSNSNAVFQCVTADQWALTNPGPFTAFSTAPTAAVSCGPFVWVGSGTASGTCAGAFGVVITEAP